MNPNENAMFGAINEARTRRGLSPLQSDARLVQAARLHAEDMAAGRVNLDNSHIGPDGSTVVQRVGRQGYGAAAAREMTGWGWGSWTESAQLAYWLGSPAHAAIIYDGTLSDTGVAYLRQAVSWTNLDQWWVVVLGRPTAEEKPAPPGTEPPAIPPHVVYAPIVVSGAARAGIDLLEYLRGDGRAYRVGNQRGTFEVMQTQTEGDRFYQVKAWDDLSVVHWEEFVVSGETIGRDVDTSPGGGRFYRQFGAPWVRRWMRPGESFSQSKRIQFYSAADCSEQAAFSGTVTDTITLVEHLSEWRSVFGVALRDVVRLRWEQGGEDYFYARGYGLVAWRRAHNDENSPVWSAIAEMRPDVGTLARLAIPCL